MTELCMNMKQRPMKTVRKVSPESNRKESFYSSSIPLLNYESVYDRKASFIFYKVMMIYFIV